MQGMTKNSPVVYIAQLLASLWLLASPFSVQANGAGTNCNSYQLEKGWNLISFPCDTSDTVETVLGGVPQLRALWSLTEKGWESFHPYAREIDTNHSITEIDPAKGYWAYLSQEVDVIFGGSWSEWSGEAPEFVNGWNLIGVGDTPPSNLPTFLDYNAADIVWGWDQGKWSSFRPDLPLNLNSLKAMERGKGYYLYVRSANHRPVAISAGFSMDEDTTLNTALQGSDQDSSDTLTFHLISTTVNGTATLTSEGNLSYVPTSNFDGIDQLTFTVHDGRRESEAAVVTITVNPQPDPPVAEDFSLTMAAKGGAIGGLLSGHDPDGTAVTYAIQIQPTRGSVTLDGRLFFYTPASGESGGEDGFTYSVNSGGETVRGTVTIQLPTGESRWDSMTWDQDNWE